MIKAARQLIFPDQCPLCRALLVGDGGLCGACWRETPFILGLVCDLCGTPLIGRDDGTSIHCDACRALARPWDKGRAVMGYSGNGRRMILGLKHGDRLDLAPSFAQWMAARSGPLIDETTVLVPVPSHWRRLIKRRYNQSAVLSRLLSKHVGRPHCPDALIRSRATAPLSDHDYESRFASIDGAIQVNRARSQKLAGKSVLLVDDVMTSGATLAACSLQLRQNGVSRINVITACRASQFS